MNQWFDPKEKLPSDEQECLLMPVDHGGLTTVAVYGPICWRAKDNVWMDIFRDPEAGSIITPERVGKWCDWASIAPSEPA
jgi:hypothetical protein